MFGSIDGAVVPSLVFRCLQGALSVFITFTCVKYFEVSTIGVVGSLTPMFVCCLAHFLLEERLKLRDQGALLFVFVCVCLVLVGGDKTHNAGNTQLLPLVALLSQPLLLAAGMVAMRQMRRLPEHNLAEIFLLSHAFE